ncbi:MAG: hypothetical protein O6826_10705, partial [Acidobacteria bacterium]|nr:hypothetical protein [Acidobacteriota bacterium]
MRHVLLEAIILEFSLRVFREVKIEAAQALQKFGDRPRIRGEFLGLSPNFRRACAASILTSLNTRNENSRM